MATTKVSDVVNRDKVFPLHVHQNATFYGMVDEVRNKVLSNGFNAIEFVLYRPTVKIFFDDVDGNGQLILDREVVVDHVRFMTRMETVYSPTGVLQLFASVAVRSRIAKYYRRDKTFSYGPDYAHAITGI